MRQGHGARSDRKLGGPGRRRLQDSARHGVCDFLDFVSRPGGWKIWDIHEPILSLRVDRVRRRARPDSVQGCPTPRRDGGFAVSAKPTPPSPASRPTQRRRSAPSTASRQWIWRHRLRDRSFSYARGLRANRRPDEALATIEQCRAVEPKRPGIPLFAGLVLGDLGRNEEAAKSLMKFHIRGLTWQSLRRYADAISNVKNLDGLVGDAYRRAIDDRPDDPDTFRAFIRTLGIFYTPETDLGARLAKLSRPGEVFEVCAEDRAAKQDWRSLKQLADEMCRLDPKLPAALFYRAAPRRPRSSRRRLRSSRSATISPWRRTPSSPESVAIDWRPRLASSGLSRRTISEGEVAFRDLAAELDKPETNARSASLSDGTGKSIPTIRTSSCTAASSSPTKGKLAEADETLTRAATSCRRRSSLEPASPHSSALYECGNAASALDDFDDPELTMRDLTYWCLSDGKLDLLADLVDTWEKKRRRFPTAWRGSNFAPDKGKSTRPLTSTARKSPRCSSTRRGGEGGEAGREGPFLLRRIRLRAVLRRNGTGGSSPRSVSSGNQSRERVLPALPKRSSAPGIGEGSNA